MQAWELEEKQRKERNEAMRKRMLFVPGINPHRLPGHKERGGKKYWYTYKEVVEASGYEVEYVRRYAPVNGGLQKVAEFVQRGRGRLAKEPMSDAEVGEFLPEKELGWYRTRWPRFRFFRCPACVRDDVTEYVVQLEPGFCIKHGGSPRPAAVLMNGFYALLTGGERYTPLHEIIRPGSHHLDGNVWNNRLSNLTVVSEKGEV